MTVVVQDLSKIIEMLQQRDAAWEARVAEKQRQIDGWIRSCLEVQRNWEEEHRKLSEVEDELAAVSARLDRSVNDLTESDACIAEQESQIFNLQRELENVNGHG